MTSDIQFEQKKHLGLVTLNRPKALHALTFPMILALHQQLTQWALDDAIHAVVIQATPCKAFCAGGDVRWLYDAKQPLFFQHEYRLNQLIHDYKKPYIALMDGMTMGGGVGISLHGSHAVGSLNFVFAMPETSIGLFPDIGAGYLLARCPGAFGVYLGLTGHRLNAFEAQVLGLLTYVVDAHDFPAVLSTLMTADLTTEAHARVCDVLQPFAKLPLASLSVQQAHVDACFSGTDMGSIMASLASFGEDAWYRDTRALLEKKSPISLSVTLKQLQRARSMTLSDGLNMDYTLVQHFLRGHDFYEGVRALLIDKTNAPQWQPSRLSQVTPAMVDAYFVPGYRLF